MINFLKKRKFEIAIFLIIIGIIICNSYLYINNNIFVPLYPNKSVSAYEYWEYVRTDALGILILFTSPLLIMIMSCYDFYQKLYSKIYQYFFLRYKVNNFFNSNILKCYIKSILFIPLISLIIFLIGSFMLPNSSSYFNNTFILLSIINNMLFSIICCNIFMFFQTKFKEFYKILISSFLFLFISNYILYFILLIIFKITNINIFDTVASSIELYQGYNSDINVIITFLYLIICSVVTTIFIFNKYKKHREAIEVYE